MRTWQAENFGAGTGERKEAACRQKSGHESERKPHAGRKAGTRTKGNRVQAEKRARERKEAACRQKSRHENERKPRAGRKAGTRAKGNRMQAEKRAREKKETACRQKSGHERKRKPRAGRKAGTREKAGGARLSEFQCACFIFAEGSYRLICRCTENQPVWN